MKNSGFPFLFFWFFCKASNTSKVTLLEMSSSGKGLVERNLPVQQTVNHRVVNHPSPECPARDMGVVKPLFLEMLDWCCAKDPLKVGRNNHVVDVNRSGEVHSSLFN
jgi:hypothetical protein